MLSETELTGLLAWRENYRDSYTRCGDPIAEDRLIWNAQAFRHTMHLLPGHTILEIGCGSGLMTRCIHDVSRGECPIIAITFNLHTIRPSTLPPDIEFIAGRTLPGDLEGRQFDFIIADGMLDRRCHAWLIGKIHGLLAPGGRVLFFESNPWNIISRSYLIMSSMVGKAHYNLMLNRWQLHELLSEIGFTSVFTLYNDFVYVPSSRPSAWALRNLSVIFENARLIQTLARSVLIHGEKPPHRADLPSVTFAALGNLRHAISVVVPCKNEEMNVGPLVERLLKLFGEFIYEIILVDDGSTDSTRAVIAAFAASNNRIKPIYREPPSGVGYALKDGLRAATGQYVLTMDCDFQHLLPEVRDLFDAAAMGYDVAVGSRFSRHSILLNYPFQKIVANRMFHLLGQIVLRARFRDMTNNLKLLHREVVEKLVLLEPGFAVNAEIGLQPLLMGYKVKEVPISWIGRGYDMGTSSFRVLRVGGGYWRVLRRLWQHRFFQAGVYRALSLAPGQENLHKNWNQPLETTRTPVQ